MQLFKRWSNSSLAGGRSARRPSAWLPPHLISDALLWLPAIALLALVLVPLCLLGWLIFFTDIFVVQAITVTDARPHTTQSVRQIIAEYIIQNPVSKNIFFIQSDSLEQQIAGRLPQVRTVHVARALPGTVKAIVQEKTAALLFVSNATYYFVDDQGIAYEEARLETLPGTILPTVKNIDSGSQVTVGVPVVAKSFVDFVQFMDHELPAMAQAAVVEIRIPSLSAREVHFLLSNNWVIRFDVTRPPAGQLETLKKLLAGTVPPEEQQRLEYIDLRIPDRVYYKTKDAPPARPAVSPRPTPPTADTE